MHVCGDILVSNASCYNATQHKINQILCQSLINELPLKTCSCCNLEFKGVSHCWIYSFNIPYKEELTLVTYIYKAFQMSTAKLCNFQYRKGKRNSNKMEKHLYLFVFVFSTDFQVCVFELFLMRSRKAVAKSKVCIWFWFLLMSIELSVTTREPKC